MTNFLNAEEGVKLKLKRGGPPTNNKRTIKGKAAFWRESCSLGSQAILAQAKNCGIELN